MPHWSQIPLENCTVRYSTQLGSRRPIIQIRHNFYNSTQFLQFELKNYVLIKYLKFKWFSAALKSKNIFLNITITIIYFEEIDKLKIHNYPWLWLNKWFDLIIYFKGPRNKLSQKIFSKIVNFSGHTKRQLWRH